MRKSLAMIGLPILLGGCGLPPALTAASWALDGVSYLVSGKSVTDHAISEVASQDCALFRIVQDREICEDFEVDGNEGMVLVASVVVPEPLSEPADGLASVGPSDPLFVPPEIAAFVEGFGPGTVEVEQEATIAAFQPATLHWQEVGPLEGRYLAATPKARPEAHCAALDALPRPDQQITPVWRSAVIGSFANPDNAAGLAARHSTLNAEVQIVRTNGKTWHRVVVDASLEDVRRAGYADAWMLKAPVRINHVQLAAAN